MADNNEDIVFDADRDDSVVADEHAGETVKKLREKLKDAEEKARTNLDDLQRAKADFVNMRKRDEEAKADFLKFAVSGFIEELLPVVDSMDLASAHGDKNMEAVQKLFLQILKARGLEELSPLGESFDPKFHEAVALQETEKQEEDHKILEVVQKGYILEGKIIRPAKVKVGEYKGD